MHFQQFAAMIPVFEQIESSCTSQTIHCSSDTHMLIVVLQGHVTVSAPGLEPVVVTQAYACHPQHGPFDLVVPKTKDAEYIVIAYRVIPENSLWTLRGPLRTHSEVKIKYMLDELLRTTLEIDTGTAEEAAAQQVRKRMIMERILFIFLYETQMTQADKSSTASIEEGVSYIQEHYMLKLTLPMLAQRAGVSEGHYTVLFKQLTGMTLTRYLRKIRIEKAKQMFRQTELSAKDIAQRAGFADYFHFSRVFKQEVGCSPAAFRKNEAKI